MVELLCIIEAELLCIIEAEGLFERTFHFQLQVKAFCTDTKSGHWSFAQSGTMIQGTFLSDHCQNVTIFCVLSDVSSAYNPPSWLPQSIYLYSIYLHSSTPTTLPFNWFSLLSFSWFLRFWVLAKQKRKLINLTISTKDKYKNIPAVTVKIQSWTCGSADTERPM